MNTLNYIGCKKTLFKTILQVCEKNIPNLGDKSFLDIFAGTGVVSFQMIDYFSSVSCNDLELYSSVICTALVKVPYTENLARLIEQCNRLPGREGLIYRHFSPHAGSERMFFTPENARKADAIRMHIDSMCRGGEITKLEHDFLLASLLTSIDKVANTTSVYGAYLKKFKKSAKNPIILSPIHTRPTLPCNGNEVFNQAAEDLAVAGKHFDVVYMDPPYNSRQYSGNYSQLNYIARYDDSIEIKGKTGLMVDRKKSSFCIRRSVKDAFSSLVKNLDCDYLVMSYNDEGLLSVDELVDILSSKGDVKLYKIKYKKYKSQKKQGISYIYEYLWVVTSTDHHDCPIFYEEEIDLVT